MKTQFVRKLFAPLAIVAALGLASGQGLAADIKERNLKFPIVNAIDHPQGLGAQKFVDVVGQKSGGKIKVKIFPNGTLGGEQQVAAAMQGGTVEISMMSPAQLVGTIKEFVVLDFPFSFANEAQADAVEAPDGGFLRHAGSGPGGAVVPLHGDERELVAVGAEEGQRRAAFGLSVALDEVAVEDIEGLT